MQPTLLLRGELPGARARFSGYFRVDLHVIENHLLTVSFSDFVLQQLVARNGISLPSLVLHVRHWHQVYFDHPVETLKLEAWYDLLTSRLYHLHHLSRHQLEHQEPDHPQRSLRPSRSNWGSRRCGSCWTRTLVRR